MKSLLVAVMSAAVMGGGLPLAAAEPVSGLYGSLGFGIGSQDRLTIDRVGTPFGRQPGGYIDAKTGFTGSGGIGWGFANGIRAELELNYRSNTFERATAGALRDANARGTGKTTSTFVNAYYDFDLAPLGVPWLTPYLGAGLGYSWTEWDKVDAFNAAEYVSHSSSDQSLAYQVIAGAAVAVPTVKGLSLTAEYRLSGLFNDQSYDGRVLVSRFGSFPITSHTSGRINHSVMLGLRYALGSWQ